MLKVINPRIRAKLDILKRYLKHLEPRNIKEILIAESIYKNNKSILRLLTREPKTKVAAVIHLYYLESWGLFSANLKALNKVNFDIYVTMPKTNLWFAEKIKKQYPNAQILEVPNRGRDVLPFLRTAEVLYEMGYESILKVHSKKSTHRTDGDVWLKDITNRLLPANKKTILDTLNKLDDTNTGIIGPDEQYLSLLVNFDANGLHATKILRKIYKSRAKVYDVLQSNRTEYGFFAGTMFWARLDAIKPILDVHFTVGRFERETGQIDGTFAHALERVFCLVPEIDGKSMYEIGASGINKINYKTDNIPDWSDVYIGPKEQI